jgi:hypothetical protein
MEGMGSEERKDIDEINAGDGEIGELAESGTQAYLCTGEFGGTGGRGGGLGLWSRGMVIVWRLWGV